MTKKIDNTNQRLITNPLLFLCGVVARLFKHRHKWQVRGRSRYQNPTYRICLKCRQAQSWNGGLNGKFVDCEPIPDLDAQFDDNDKFIF